MSGNRSVLANERTFSAWVRTGMAATAAGLGIARLLGTARSIWLTEAIGALFVLVGGGSFAIGLWRYQQERQALEQAGIKVPPTWMFQGLVLVLFLVVVLSFVLLFVG